MSGNALYPCDIDLLARVHLRLCAERKIDPSSLEAEEVAAALILAFQLGARHEADILTIARRGAPFEYLKAG